VSLSAQVNHSRYTTQCAPKYPDDAKSYAHLALAMLTCYLVPMVVIVVCSGSHVNFYEILSASKFLKLTLFIFLQMKPTKCTLSYGPAKLRDSIRIRIGRPIRFERDWPIRKFSNRIGRACSFARRKLSQTTQTINST